MSETTWERRARMLRDIILHEQEMKKPSALDFGPNEEAVDDNRNILIG